MKKITGKVVSLVLALALVVSSFSANFAFAATKSAAGVVTDTAADDIYLCNGDGDKGARGTDLNKFLTASSDFNMETKNHKDVDDYKVSSISHVSGDRLVSLKLSNNDDDATLRLKSSTKSGTEVISVLYKANYTDDDGVEYTVRASQKLTVHVYDAGQIVFGKAKSEGDRLGKDVGKGVDDLDDMPMTAGAQVKIGVYTATQLSADDCLAVLTDAPKNLFLTTAKKGFNNVKDSGYALEVTSGASDIHFFNDQITEVKDETAAKTAEPKTLTDSALVATLGKYNKNDGTITADASTGNVTITAKKIDKDGKVSNDSDDKYTLKAKIAKKVDIPALKTYDTTKVEMTGFKYAFKQGSKFSNTAKDSNYTLSKTDGKSVIDGLTGFDGKPAVVTDKEINFPEGTGTVTVGEDVNVKKISGQMDTLTIDDCSVGTVDIGGGNVIVSEGKVGDITVGNDVKGKGQVTVSDGAKVGNIKTTDVDDTVELIKIDGATTGTIETDNKVEISTNDDDHPVTTGIITAAKVTAYADESKVSIAGIKAADEDAEFTLYNSDNMELKVGKIDFDSYDGAKLYLGNEDDEDDVFTGTIPAPVNAVDGTIETKNEDTDVTVTGKVDVDTISVDSDSTITFKDDVKAKTIDGDGTMVAIPGKLYVTESASSTKLKLAGDVKVGTVVFKATAGNVDTDDFNCFGFTLDKSTASGVDTFKIKSVSFAGLQINKTASSIAKGYSETFTASAYPTGTAIPAGYTVKWDLDGGSSDVFTMTTTGNTATVKVNSIDATFTSENHTTLTATLYDADGYEVDDYPAAKCEINATAVPAATIDTTHDFSVAQGASYQFKVTSTTTPSFTVGTQGVFNVALASKNGNDYFYKITAVGKVGSSTGVYLNGTKVCVVSVKAPAFTCDTNKDITVKGSYQVKVTATATPTFSVGTAGVFKASFVKKVGNDYFYKIESVGKAGTKAGIFVNGVKVFVATVG